MGSVRQEHLGREMERNSFEKLGRSAGRSAGRRVGCSRESLTR